MDVDVSGSSVVIESLECDGDSGSLNNAADDSASSHTYVASCILSPIFHRVLSASCACHHYHQHHHERRVKRDRGRHVAWCVPREVAMACHRPACGRYPSSTTSWCRREAWQPSNQLIPIPSRETACARVCVRASEQQTTTARNRSIQHHPTNRISISLCFVLMTI